MARQGLQQYEGTVQTYSATVERRATTIKGRIVLMLVDVRHESGALVTDHAWIPFSSAIRALDVGFGDRLSFSACVETYWKGKRFETAQQDYQFVRLTKIRRVC